MIVLFYDDWVSIKNDTFHLLIIKEIGKVIFQSKHLWEKNILMMILRKFAYNRLILLPVIAQKTGDKFLFPNSYCQYEEPPNLVALFLCEEQKQQ